MLADRKLTREQALSRAQFFNQLSTPDGNNIDHVIRTVDRIARQSFTPGLHEDYPSQTLADLNSWAYCLQDIERCHNILWSGDVWVGREKIIGRPFFAVYATGGQVTKQGQRKDIDLIVATNSGWPQSGAILSEAYNPLLWYKPREDRQSVDFIYELELRYSETCVEANDSLPDAYNMNRLEPTQKTLIKVKPKGDCLPIDITYMSSMKRDPGLGLAFVDKPESQTIFLTMEDFEKRLDTDRQTNLSLPRILLYQAIQQYVSLSKP